TLPGGGRVAGGAWQTPRPVRDRGTGGGAGTRRRGRSVVPERLERGVDGADPGRQAGDYACPPRVLSDVPLVWGLHGGPLRADCRDGTAVPATGHAPVPGHAEFPGQ